VHVAEVTGLLDHLSTLPDGRGDVFDLAENLGVDYDRMTAVTRAAEQLGWVTTPGDIVQLTLAGREFLAADAYTRKAMVRDRFAAHPLSARVLAMLRDQGEEGEEYGVLDEDDLLADLTIYFPFIPAETLLATLVEWGREAGILDHDADARRVMLLEG
jgi:NitT/TauT family transport system ATP-binding protein